MGIENKNPVEKQKKQEVIKQNALLLSNIAQSINNKQARLLTYAIMNLEMEGNTPFSRFSLVNFLKACDYSKDDYKKKDIKRDIDKLSSVQIKSADENFFLDKSIGIGTYNVKNPIYEFDYDNGQFTVEWASNAKNVEMLKNVTEEVSKYDFNLLLALNSDSWSLYEVLVALKQRGVFNLELNAIELGLFFKVEGRNSANYSYLKHRYLSPALKEINDNKLDIHVEATDIKEGRKKIGVKLIFDDRKLANLPSEVQVKMTEKLLVFFLEYDEYFLSDKEYQETKQKLSDYQKYNAGQLFSINKEARAVQTRIRKELGLLNSQSYIVNKSLEYLENYKGATPFENESFEFVKLVEQFSVEERQKVIDLAIQIFDESDGKRLAYINQILRGWLGKGITTVELADKDYLEHFGGFEKRELKKLNKVTVSDDFKLAMNLWGD